MIKHAYENVEFYHRKFDSLGIKPSDVKTGGDLAKFPVTTKSDVQKNFGQMIARGVEMRKCEIATTSGSTGRPLTVVLDNHDSDFRWAISLRQLFECGGKVRDRQVQLRWWQPKQPNHKSFFERMGFLNQYWLSIREPIEKITQEIERIRPNIVTSYPSFLRILINESKKKKIEIYPRLVFSLGEVLDINCRALITSTFGAKVIDCYGCIELGDLAWECPDNPSYHMNADCNVIEFIRDGEPVASEERGEIVVTSLVNRAMPLIRYDIGDIGVPHDEQCSCGRGLPLMKLIEGRCDDFITLPSGRILSPLSFHEDPYYYPIPGVTEYMVIQKKRDQIKVQLVTEDGHSQKTIANRVTRRLGEIVEGVSIEVEFVEKIERLRKLRNVISKVSSSLA